MKCAICGDKIKGKAETLGDGNTVCKDCYETSAMVVTCEQCGQKFGAMSALRDDDSIYCKKCYAERLKEAHHDWLFWKDWQKSAGKYGEIAPIDDWLACVMDNIEYYVKEGAPQIWEKCALKVAADEIEKAKEIEAAKIAA